MIIFQDLETICVSEPCVVTIGKFDGIHRGHAELIRAARRFADACPEPVSVAVFTFDTSSATLLTAKERRAYLSKLGADVLVECEFGPQLITMEAGDFVRDILKDRLRMCHAVTGEDYRFGYARRGDPAFLLEAGRSCGFTAETVPAVEYRGSKISSTRIREALQQGKMEEVQDMLGFPFFVTGEIIHGRQLGRTIGVPTTNLIPGRGKLLPPNGVYCSRSFAGGEQFRGITNIGTKPTVEGGFVGVETYLFDCSEDLYGASQKVELLHFVRPEQKFRDLKELKERIRLDEEEGRTFFRTGETAGIPGDS